MIMVTFSLASAFAPWGNDGNLAMAILAVARFGNLLHMHLYYYIISHYVILHQKIVSLAKHFQFVSQTVCTQHHNPPSGLGFGIGGCYPLSAAKSAEGGGHSSVGDKNYKVGLNLLFQVCDVLGNTNEEEIEKYKI